MSFKYTLDSGIMDPTSNRSNSRESVLTDIKITDDGKQRSIADIYADFVSSDAYREKRSFLKNALNSTNGSVLDYDTWLYFFRGYSEMLELTQREIETKMSSNSFGAYVRYLISLKIPFSKDNNLNVARERYVIRESLYNYFGDLKRLLGSVCERRCVSDLTGFEKYFNFFLIYYRYAGEYDEALSKNDSSNLDAISSNTNQALSNLERIRVSNSGFFSGNNKKHNKQYSLFSFPLRPYV